MKMCYLGSNIPQYLKEEYYDMDFYNTSPDQFDIYKVINIYDMLIIEISSENMENVLKWVFRLHCKKKIPILAILIGCSNADKIILNKFKITDYIDIGCKPHEIKKICDTIILRMNWKKTE
ncbi:MAG: hypothetical protein K2M73_08980 [Lachnospiraceae bacterium]|nr:hypothetical protein [Lachnospiraceae bacterium]